MTPTATSENEAIDFASRVRAARNARSLSQADLGELCGLSRDQIAAIEAGRRDVSVMELYPLAKSLGVRVLDLLGMDDEEEEKPRYRNLPIGTDVRQLEEFAHTFLRREASLRRVTGLAKSS